jgi:hypothetical protein
LRLDEHGGPGIPRGTRISYRDLTSLKRVTQVRTLSSFCIYRRLIFICMEEEGEIYVFKNPKTPNDSDPPDPD